MKIESERIVNLKDYESLINEARSSIDWLKRHLAKKNFEESIHLAGQIDLALHRMEEYEFQIERRVITESAGLQEKTSKAQAAVGTNPLALTQMLDGKTISRLEISR